MPTLEEKQIQKKYIRRQEAVKRYGLSRAWWEQMAHKKTGPPMVKLNRACLYEVEELDKWFADQKMIFGVEEKEREK